MCLPSVKSDFVKLGLCLLPWQPGGTTLYTLYTQHNFRGSKQELLDLLVFEPLGEAGEALSRKVTQLDLY